MDLNKNVEIFQKRISRWIQSWSVRIGTDMAKLDIFEPMKNGLSNTLSKTFEGAIAYTVWIISYVVLIVESWGRACDGRIS